MVRPLRCWSLVLLLAVLFGGEARAQARFDLAGPRIEVRVTRGGTTLPIAEVPNLLPGDQIWLHPAFPPDQAVHYLLIAAFLRGTTNPPPDDWFLRIETWNKRIREEGTNVTVPPGAQQAILFLAPETAGDFSTLRSAVKGRPGIFVRADQDLIEAGFEQARIEKYTAEMKNVALGDQNALTDHSNLLARTLNLKPNPDCFKRTLDMQSSCLTQTGNQTLLDDGHGQTLAATLSNGPSSELINQASYTGLAGAGTYSAYVGAIVDLLRLTSGLHTAQYQYIPAIAFPDDAALNLRLNTAPSFHNPKSVIVIGLPAVQKAIPPPLRPADPTRTSCLLNPKVVLPIEGAPLVFSTAFAHGLVLHLNLPAGVVLPRGVLRDVPLAPDAFQGGLTVAPAEPSRRELPPVDAAAPPAQGKTRRPEGAVLNVPFEPLPPAITGTIEGKWGFDAFAGPTLAVQAVPGSGWHIVSASGAPDSLIAGQPNHLQISASATACVQSIHLQPGGAKVDWKLSANPAAAGVFQTAAPLDLTLNLQQAVSPGSIQLAIQQFGEKAPDQLGTRTFAESAKIESVQFHAGDSALQLSGAGLDQVKQLTVKNAVFLPASHRDASQERVLTFALAKDAKPPAAEQDEKLQVQVLLGDGRTLTASTSALAPRPTLSVLSRRLATASPSPIDLSSPDEVPLGAQLLFFLKSPKPFPRAEQIQIANEDGSLQTNLNLKDGTLVLQDLSTVLATFDPLKTFGPSSFGPFRARAIAPDGTEGEWQPLATIVRLPTLTELRCGPAPADACLLTGSALYLIDSVATDRPFLDATRVPEGFVDSTLTIPHPTGPSFFLRLRDDPKPVQQVTLGITPNPQPTISHSSPQPH